MMPQIQEAMLYPCHSIESTVAALLTQYGEQARICVLPEGSSDDSLS